MHMGAPINGRLCFFSLLVCSCAGALQRLVLTEHVLRVVQASTPRLQGRITRASLGW